MDLKDLKKAWDKYSSKERGNELDENAIREMLRGRTKSLIDRIERNIKIGFIVILGLILFFILDDLVISPLLVEGISEEIEVPGWVIILDLITNFIIVATFIMFAWNYYRVKKKCDVVSDLPDTLKKIIRILNIYQRLFYFAIFVLLASTASGFIAGMYKGVVYSAQENGFSVNELETGHILFIVFIGLLVLALISAGLFFLFRWGFRRLYGNYLKKLKLTLKELNEIE